MNAFSIYEDQFEKYFSGGMTEKEKLDFDSAVKANKDMREAFTLYRLEREAAEMLVQAELKKTMKGWQSASGPGVKENKLPLRRWLLAAAAGFALVFCLFYVDARNTYTNKSLAGKFYQPELYRGVKGESDFTDPLATVQRILDANQSDQFDTLIYILSSKSIESPNYHDFQYYLGHLKYRKAHFSQAVDHFTNAATGKNANLVSDAKWYRTIAKLRLDELDDLFYQDLSQLMSDPKYGNVATKLDVRIKSVWRELM